MFDRPVAAAVLLAACSACFAQTPAESRAAAEAWMAKDTLKIHFTSTTGFSTTFETDVKAGKTNFIGNPDRVCLVTGVPTKIDYVEPKLGVQFDPARAGGQSRQYVFDPVSGEGKNFRPDGNAWVELQPAGKIRLLR